MNWTESSAPSNIALIKYMGKTDSVGNRPTNASLSWTLENLRTYVRIRELKKDQHKDQARDQHQHEAQHEAQYLDQWSCFERSDLRPLSLSEKGQQKFLDFFQVLKKEFKLSGFYEIQSANNFPSDCGLASSASSFAALTKCAHDYYLAASQNKARPYTAKELSRLSQKGSGSSCRSFFSPWALWHDSGAEEIQLPLKNLKHMVVLCDESVKDVSSSEAHKRVLSSDLFKGRVERAAERLQNLIASLRENNWKKSSEICWNEFWDMHTLFHTSNPSFMYMNGASLDVLKGVNDYWQKKADGPLITMDAGSNIHLLFRNDQQDLYNSLQNSFLKGQFNLWTDAGYIQTPIARQGGT